MKRKAQEDAEDVKLTPDTSPAKDAPPVSPGPSSEGEIVSFEDVINELTAVARGMRATTVMMTAIHHPGEKLVGSNYPSGKGGHTEYGVCFITEWLKRQEPSFISPSQKDAMAVCFALEEQREETWGITRTIGDEESPTMTSPASDDGDGSEAPDDSRKRHTGGRSQIASLAKRARSRRTSSRR